MHWTTYSRLAKRYTVLQRARDWAFCAEVYSMSAVFAIGSKEEGQVLAALASNEWQEFKRSKRRALDGLQPAGGVGGAL